MADQKEGHPLFEDGEERILAEAMKKIQIRPSEETKEKSFQMALKGVQQARKVAERRRKMKRTRDLIILVAAAAAALFLVFQFVLPDFLQQQTAKGPEDGGAQGAVEEQTPEEEAKEETSPPDQEGQEEGPMKEEGGPEVNRPPHKKITTYPEGIKEEKVYHLYADDIFSTYIFPEWKAESMSRSWKEGEGLAVVRIEPKEEEHTYGEMEILFFPASADGKEVEEYVKAQYVQNNPYEIYPPTGEMGAEWYEWEIFPWAQITYRYRKDEGELGRKGYVRLGQHDGRWFAVWEESGALAEAWPHWAGVVYDEWIWTESGEPLQSK